MRSSAYDAELERLGVGNLTLLMGVRRAIEGKCTAYHLMHGLGYYKQRWGAAQLRGGSAAVAPARRVTRESGGGGWCG